ncbi:MAG: hypothetical protein GW855_11105 [Erythrobacter sp.]|nr:hypothetical protein [Erythrobacter sp.]NCQ62500.1 hypothetical protein [Alphaproteobacteria bacterium]
MKEGTLADRNHIREEHDSKRGGFTGSAVFPVLVGLWFAALFGAGCLFLPPVLFDMILGGATPFGQNTRIVIALGAAAIGLLMGVLIAFAVRGSEKRDAAPARAPRPKRKGKGDARPPLDVRSALGLSSLDDEEDDDFELSPPVESDEYDFDDDAKPPIDDPYFASAWSDADAQEPISEDVAADDSDLFELEDVHYVQDGTPEPWTNPAYADGPEPAQVAPSRYNPFAERVKPDEAAASEWPEQRPFEAECSFAPAQPASQSDYASARIEQPRESQAEDPEPHASAPPPSAPPPPAWPQPRAEEPELGELGVAELVERLARALQGQVDVHSQAVPVSFTAPPAEEPRASDRVDESPQPERRAASEGDVDRALRLALDRLARLDDVA